MTIMPTGRVCLLLLTLWLGACGQTSWDAATVLRVWAHGGQLEERKTLSEQVARFNARNRGRVRVALTFLPEGAYNGQIQAAALAGDLPDILEIDGPFLYNYVWAGNLRPLDGLLSSGTQQELLPSIRRQGSYDGRLYGVGTFDSGLGLYVRRSELDAIGARLPDAPSEAWSVVEFEEILAKLARRDADGAVLDLKLNYSGEWFSYGFAPVVQSAGGDLIERDAYQHAHGVLDGGEAVQAMRYLQSWFDAGYVDANLDDAAFVQGRVAMSWVGHWEYPRYRAAWADDLALVPLPDFGRGSRTGQGSWQWAVTHNCVAPQAAASFLAFLLETDEVLAMSEANGAVPATYSAVARSRSYAPGGPLNLFVQQLTEGYAIPRPQTPAYPMISAVFTRAFHDIRHGADVTAALNRAATLIERDIADNHGYPQLGMRESQRD